MTSPQERYESYVRFCKSVGVEPLNFEQWQMTPTTSLMTKRRGK